MLARHLRTRFYCFDGNFKLQCYAKKNNQEDRSHWGGRGYMRDGEMVKEHVQEHRDLPVEVSTIRVRWNKHFLMDHQRKEIAGSFL